MQSWTLWSSTHKCCPIFLSWFCRWFRSSLFLRHIMIIIILHLNLTCRNQHTSLHRPSNITETGLGNQKELRSVALPYWYTYVARDYSLFQSSRGLLGFQPYPMIKSLSDVFPVVLSTAASVETWLSQLSNEDQLSHLPSSSVELLALALSALLARSLSPSSGGVPELSSIVQALSTIAKLLPTVVRCIISMYFI